VDLPQGASWYRYNGDGYGEHEDGSPFDGTGVGRPWPLLTGERAHYELAAGHRESAESLLTALENFAGVGRLIPEQVWDSADIPELGLFRGNLTGSACPLVWAHAEYVKLRRSLLEGEIFDRPPQPVERYQVQKKIATHVDWRFNNRISSMPQGKTLRLSLLLPSQVHWSCDGWTTAHDTATRDTGLGVHTLDLPTRDITAGSEISFTLYWPTTDRWEGTDFRIAVNPETVNSKEVAAVELNLVETVSGND
jgi:glucoamylase